MKKTVLFFLSLLLILCLNAQQNDRYIMLIHKSNKTYYNLSKKVPVYSVYILTKNQVKNVSRPLKFINDPNIDKSYQLSDKDYIILNNGSKDKNMTFDKGHLSPSDDFRNDSQSENESMYFTNVAPQNSNFNEVEWRKLENYVRSLAIKYDTLIIKTGCITTHNIVKEYYIPDYYYKQIVIKQTNDTLTYKMPNKADNNDFSNYKVSNNEIKNYLSNLK